MYCLATEESLVTIHRYIESSPSHATYYGEGRSKYINTAAFLGTLQGNKIVLTHEAYGFMLNIDEVNEGNMEKMASPYTLYYMPQSKAFMRNDGQVYILQ